MQGLDWYLFHLINGLAGHVDLLDDFLTACAKDLQYALLALVATLWVTLARDRAATYRRQSVVVYAVLAALLALGVNQVVGAIWYRPRPFVHHAVTLLLPPSTDASFPSDHAAGGFALAVAVLFARDLWARRVGWLLAAMAALLAFARVYCGTHYPFDVIAGAGVGTAAAFAVWRAQPVLDPALRPLLLPLHRFTLAVLERLHLHRWVVAPS